MSGRTTDLEVDELGEVGVGDEHLMETGADETLHLPYGAQQLLVFLKKQVKLLLK